METSSAEIVAPDGDAAILRRQGSPPVGRDADLRAVYTAMTAYALRKILDEDK